MWLSSNIEQGDLLLPSDAHFLVEPERQRGLAATPQAAPEQGKKKASTKLAFSAVAL